MPTIAYDFSFQKHSSKGMLVRNRFYAFLSRREKISGKEIHFLQGTTNIFSV